MFWRLVRAREQTNNDPRMAAELFREHKATHLGMVREAWNNPDTATRVLELERAFPKGQFGKRLPMVSFSGYESNALFHNRGDGKFEEIGVASGAGRREDGRGVAVVDLDRDGRLDLVMSNFYRRPLMVLHNQGTGEGAWLGVRLRGKKSNRFGVGARVTVRAGERRWVQEVTAGNGFMSSQPSELHFGLGEQETVSMQVRWPTGEVQKFEEVRSRALVTVTEGEAQVKREPARNSARVNQAPRARAARAGDPIAVTELKGPSGARVTLPPAKGRLVLILFSGGCLQCRQELAEADRLDALLESMDETQVVWASLDEQQEKVEKYFKWQEIERSFVMVDEETKAALLGPGKPQLPVTFVVSREGIEAKFIGKDSAVRALEWTCGEGGRRETG